MNEELSLTLEEYGINKKEAKIFLFLVGKNELTAYEIAKELGFFRSTTYEILEKLIEKGFVTKSVKGKVIYFRANEISSVISKLKTKEDILFSLIPKLNKIKNEKPSTRILENNIGEKQFNFELIEMINSKQIKEIYIIGNSPPSTEASLIFVERIIKEIQKARPKKYGLYKGIWSQEYRKTKFVKKYEKFGENRFLPHIISETTTFISDNFVAFMFLENETPFVIEIKSKVVAKEMKSYFEHLWKIARH